MNKILKLLILVLISLVGVYLAFRGEDSTLIINELKKVDFNGIALATIILLFSCYIRALRWKILIEPFANIPIMQVLSATMIGYFGNGVLVFRLGELLKSYMISKDSTVKTSQAFGTVILERFLDLVMVIFISLLLLPWLPIQHHKIRLAIYILFGITLIFICFIIIKKKNGPNRFLKISTFVKNTKKNKIMENIKNIYDGIISILHIKSFHFLILYSFLLWLLYLIVTIILVNSCEINLSLIDTSILFILGSLSIGIPALPGSIGTYDAAVKYTLVILFGIKSYQALNYAIISHAVSYFPLTIIGAIFFIYENISIKNMKKIGLKNETL